MFLIFWYQLYCGFSGSVMIDQMYLMLYNLVFTSLSPIAIGKFGFLVQFQFVTNKNYLQVFTTRMRQHICCFRNQVCTGKGVWALCTNRTHFGSPWQTRCTNLWSCILSRWPHIKMWRSTFGSSERRLLQPVFLSI